MGETLGAVLADRFERLRKQHAANARGTARKALEDPAVYDLDKLNNPQRMALVGFWEEWQRELPSVRILDPACGSGAFLIEAFEQMHAVYSESNERLKELRGHVSMFDLDRKILQDNLYGVDLNEEAIEICRLSLWIKTAARGKVLTSLDHTIRVGNSIVSDADVDSRAFDWRSEFPEVFDSGGFDAVVGNPPYVRQELLSNIKQYLEVNYRSYHGTADLYTYFYELGMRVLRPRGRLSFIVTNKWMRAGYGEPLRQFFSEHAWMESVIDFGHAKQIFEQADVFPSIVVVRKPSDDPAPESVRVCAIPREQLRVDDLKTQIDSEGFSTNRSRLDSGSWRLEPDGVDELYQRLKCFGQPLNEFAGVRPLTGIKTAFNKAFLVDQSTYLSLVSDDARSEELLRPYVRGADIDRWILNWQQLWMIAMKSSGDFSWPWSECESEDEAEAIFAREYPAVYGFMKQHEQRLRARSDQGKFWWELRSCAYWNTFDEPKIVYQLIQFHSQFAFDSKGRLGNNKTSFIASSDRFLLASLNSPLLWWFNWRYLQHMKDEALAPNPTEMVDLPIAVPSEETRVEVDANSNRIIEIHHSRRDTVATLLDWLHVEFDIEKLSRKLQSPLELDSDDLVAQVRKVRGRRNPLSAAGLRALRDEYDRTIEPAKALAREALDLEHRLSDLVNEAYGLTPEEIDLMWKTAPPRMPIQRPNV